MSASEKTITIETAYRAMFEFIEAYWRTGLCREDQISDMLSAMQFGEKLGPSETADPAMWSDFLAAIKKVK